MGRPPTRTGRCVFLSAQVDVGLHRVAIVQVDDADMLMFLTEPVDAADPLFHPASDSMACRSSPAPRRTGSFRPSAAASVQSSTSASPSRNRRLASSREICSHTPSAVGTSPPRPE